MGEDGPGEVDKFSENGYNKGLMITNGGEPSPYYIE
jgi:hypothetical protein